ncbi:MAG: hypothetical protein CL878_03840 [Dehalococcoidia bacterium]|nr:hypothetical protein [Dehalococcoidia bacterium]
MWGAAVLLLGIAAVTGVAGVRWSRASAEVADHAAPFVATFELRFGHPTLVGQSFQARWNNLSRIDVVLAADPDRPPPDGRLVFHLRPDIHGADVRTVGDIRTVDVPVRELGLPRRPVLDLRPGQPAEQWTSLRFAPIPDSRLQRYVWLLDYVPGQVDSRLQLLTHFNNSYRDGALYLDGAFINGNALFRLAFSGTNKDHIWITRDNLLIHARLGRELAAVLYALAAALGVLAVGVLIALWPVPRHPTQAPGTIDVR